MVLVAGRVVCACGIAEADVAVRSGPEVVAEACPVLLAIAVFPARGVADRDVACNSLPAGGADAGVVFRARPVYAIRRTDGNGALVSGPALFAAARLGCDAGAVVAGHAADRGGARGAVPSVIALAGDVVACKDPV